ncbi:DMT family transporter [Clostridium sp. WILCCON 0269]|uniref:DMT family transporter n=1 Tax=Candidatus Clostridium eludens TaxID=3381663 RepID=A0ABW8SLF7_9CLOT
MTRIYFKYFLALLLFGSNGIVASYILLNSYEIVFLRAFIGSLFLIVVFILSKGKLQGLQNKKHFIFLIISGMAMGISWMFLYEAYAEIGVSIATLIYCCGPVIVMVFAPLLFHEHLSILRILGFCIALIGMFFVNGNTLRQNGFSWGLICGILSAVMYAFMVIFNKKAKSITGLENAMLQLIASFLTVAIFMQIKQGLVISSLMQNIFPVLFLGVINTGIGCYLYFSSIQQLPAGSVGICGYLEQLSALVFSALFLQERLSGVQILGAIFIIGGAAIGELSIHKSKLNRC